ncbi:uncharacterized protein METZ01_LOCUS269974 [marine metagenome]|uniref:Uncharacterized protein n=1 Tax=marine metagenome TaxID=408172 RepID=A0A382JYB4_9ZZZZ
MKFFRFVRIERSLGGCYLPHVFRNFIKTTKKDEIIEKT